MDLAVLSLVSASLIKIADRWCELVDFLRELLDSGETLLDPIRHDQLLFDSENFSKSREYFWAINCLAEFEASISSGIEQWKEFRQYLKPIIQAASTQPEGTDSSAIADARALRELLERSDASYARLRRYQRFFQDKRAATVALRDGVR